MDYHFPDELEQFFAAQVAAGRFESMDDAVLEAMWRLRDRVRFEEMKREELRALVQEGLNSLERGEGRPLDVEEIKRKGREELAKRQAARAQRNKQAS